ncbi:ABC transporter permease subunit [Evansella sp. AB-P1]|uniref:ABC transporter permease subunit n=1 Tax=Evansella sp. AB-P1 TaxID=3037653 RepID=UPI00241C094C|nr:ABC transporter permease subunit [Evansella sp. AB-P1]MDG5785958.1 ABC transporter permease subunit [Evansella sp. AB-P1]
MLSLLKNEWIKLWTKKQPWIFVGLIIVFTLLFTLMYYSFEANTALDSDEWQMQLEQEIEQEREILQSEDASEWEKDFAEMIIEENTAYLEGGINPRQFNNLIYMNDTLLGVASFITLFSVIVASSIVSSEMNTGTIKQLVIRPYERWQFLVSKFITVVLFSIVLIVTLFVTNYILGLILFDTASWNTAMIERSFEGAMVETTAANLIFSKIGLYTLNMLVFVVISFSLSTLFRSQALAVGVGIFALFATTMSQALNFLLADTAWYKFVIIPHLSLTEYVVHDTIIEGVTLPFSLAVLAVYVIILLGLATVYFQKKDIAY